MGWWWGIFVWWVGTLHSWQWRDKHLYQANHAIKHQNKASVISLSKVNNQSEEKTSLPEQTCNKHRSLCPHPLLLHVEKVLWRRGNSETDRIRMERISLGDRGLGLPQEAPGDRNRPPHLLPPPLSSSLAFFASHSHLSCISLITYLPMCLLLVK